ncbi:MAG TPA: HIT domain-containing protein [Spirochaetota bacterium]|nr:HIT domain-containing protein [Spirochaetota bacterium]
MIEGHFFNFNKLDYVKKKKLGCILCSLIDKSSDSPDLEIYRSHLSAVSMNLYPYNSGHVMIYPLRHIESICDLSDEEAADIHRISAASVRILTDELGPTGFNIGYNIGENSGASIKHLHLHIVPRYNNELGFAEVIAGKRVCVVDPVSLLEKLRAKYAQL